MKTNKSFFTFVGLGALALALGLNFIYATNDYGISNNTLSLHVLAQTNSSGGGSSSGGSSSGSSSSGSGSSSGTGTNTGKFKEKREVSQPKTTVSCNKVKHYTTTQPGLIRTCLEPDKGHLTCVAGWFPDGPTSKPVESDCKGWFCP